MPSREMFRIQFATFLAASLISALAACSAPTPLDMPSWMADGTHWRRKLPAAVEQRLDLPMVRYIAEYKSLFGAPHYREFVVEAPKGIGDVTAAIEEALAKAGRKGIRREAERLIDDETRIDWVMPDKRVVMLVYLPNIDLSRDDEPAYVLLLEPKS